MSSGSANNSNLSKKSSDEENIAKVVRYLAQQVRANPSVLNTRPAFEPLKKLLEDTLLLKDPLASDLRKVLKPKITAIRSVSALNTSSSSTAPSSSISTPAAATGKTSETATSVAPPSAKRKRNYGDQETVDRLKRAIFDYDNQCGDAIDPETGSVLDYETFCAKVDFGPTKFRDYILEDRSRRLVPQLKPRQKKKPPREQRKHITHFANPTYSAKNKRTNWSLPENVKRLRKAVHDWDNKTGDRIDKPTGKILNLGIFSKKVRIPESTLKNYVHSDKSKRQKVGCHVGGGKQRCAPFSKEDAEMCRDVLERAEQMSQKKSREEAMEYIKMLRPDYKKHQASRVLDTHVLAKFGEHLVTTTTSKDGNDMKTPAKIHDNQNDEQQISEHNKDRQQEAASRTTPGDGTSSDHANVMNSSSDDMLDGDLNSSYGSI